MHRDNMWEYVWEDDGVLHVRHFCEVFFHEIYVIRHVFRLIFDVSYRFFIIFFFTIQVFNNQCVSEKLQDGNCKESSPEGSQQFCCSATGQQVHQMQQEL